MITLKEGLVTDVDITLAAVLLILGVLVMAIRRRTVGSRVDNLYIGLVVTTLVVSVLGVILEILEGPEDPGPYLLNLILMTMLEIDINIMTMMWFLYSFFVMYDSMDYLKRKIRIYVGPVIVMILIDIVNMFTGILWYYDEDMVYHDTNFYSLYSLIRYAYLFMSVYYYQRYKKENTGVRFFTAWTFVVPILWGTFLEWVTTSPGFTLGAAIGITMLYFMAAQEESFTDSESGSYNSHYMNLIHEKIKDGEMDPHDMIRYSLPEDADVFEFLEKLYEILPELCDTIKISDTRYVTVIYGNTRGLVNMLMEDIEIIKEELGMDIKFDHVIKKKQETALEFFEKNISIGG